MKQLVTPHTFTRNSDMSDLLNAELEDDSSYHPNLGGITRGGMANHYPMAILSMYGLGASDEQIQTFKRRWPRYRARIEEDLDLYDDREITEENWHLYLGQSHKLKEFRRVFLEKFIERDASDVVTDSLEQMRNGLPMGLFHPLIRLSFAAMHGDKGLLADALAYMAIRYRDIYLGEVGGYANSEAPEIHMVSQVWSILREQKEAHHLAGRLPSMLYGGSINICESLCSSELIKEVALGYGFEIREDNLNDRVRQICRASVKLYLFEPALTTLHAVTACQALADLTLRYAVGSDRRRVFVSLWQRAWVWLTALYIEKGCPSSLDQNSGAWSISKQSFSWQKLSEIALRSNEVHVIKMLFSCKWLFEQLDADPYYLQAAEATLGNG